MEKKLNKRNVKKVVLAYSGGLDTSIILKWLQDEYNAEVITFTADLGQGEEVEPARAKALACGIKPENIFILDIQKRTFFNQITSYPQITIIYSLLQSCTIK